MKTSVCLCRIAVEASSVFSCLHACCPIDAFVDTQLTDLVTFQEARSFDLTSFEFVDMSKAAIITLVGSVSSVCWEEIVC